MLYNKQDGLPSEGSPCKAEKDGSEKSLESYNDVFSDIVNGLLFDGQTVIDPNALTDQAPRAAYKADGKLREVERDVAKHGPGAPFGSRVPVWKTRQPPARICRCG